MGVFLGKLAATRLLIGGWLSLHSSAAATGKTDPFRGCARGLGLPVYAEERQRLSGHRWPGPPPAAQIGTLGYYFIEAMYMKVILVRQMAEQIYRNWRAGHDAHYLSASEKRQTDQRIEKFSAAAVMLLTP